MKSKRSWLTLALPTASKAMVRKKLKKVGLKTTQPRLKVLVALETSKIRHLSAEDIFKELLDSGEEISLATVYRVLAQFESAGLVIKHHFEGERSMFELNDLNHHDHMLCLECGRVFEFQDQTIEKRQHKIAAKAGFLIDDHCLYLYGVCTGMKQNGVCSMPSHPHEKSS